MAAVGQQDPAERVRAGGREDAALEPIARERGQVSRVIEMRMRQHYRIDRFGFDWKAIPVAQPEFLEPLEEPAIYQRTRVRRRDQEAAPGHGSGRAEKSEHRNCCARR